MLYLIISINFEISIDELTTDVCPAPAKVQLKYPGFVNLFLSMDGLISQAASHVLKAQYCQKHASLLLPQQFRLDK
jgi:hypothetical protein